MKKPLCSAVDTSLFIDTTGDVALCCPGEYLGNLKHTSIDEIFESNEFKQIRQDLYNGVWPNYCEVCTKSEKQASGTGYFHIINNHFPSKGSQQRQLQHLDIRWNNTCNLSCRYCNATSSSQCVKVLGKEMPSIKKDYTESVLNYIEKNKHTIRGVSLLGGEPLLQKPNERLFEILDPKTKIDIVTNLTVDLKSNKIYNIMKSKFKNITINVSFENINDQFEYVRAGANWDKFHDNLAILKQDFPEIPINCLAVYCIWSAGNLEEIYEFCARNQFNLTWQLAQYWGGDSEDSTHPGIVVAGHNQKVIDLAVDQIKIILKQYKDYINQSYNNKNFLLSMYKTLMECSKDAQSSRSFLEWVQINETVLPSKKSFQTLWPKLYHALSQN